MDNQISIPEIIKNNIYTMLKQILSKALEKDIPVEISIKENSKTIRYNNDFVYIESDMYYGDLMKFQNFYDSIMKYEGGNNE